MADEFPRSGPSEGEAIIVEHLRVQRGKRLVLPDLSVRVPTGQVVGLLGPSGGGKSTLMRSLVGVQVVAGGTITILGEPAGSAGLTIEGIIGSGDQADRSRRPSSSG